MYLMQEISAQVFIYEDEALYILPRSFANPVNKSSCLLGYNICLLYNHCTPLLWFLLG